MQKISTIGFFGWVLNKSLGISVKKNSHLKDISPVICFFILIMHILFCRTNQKNVLQKEIKDWTFEVYLLTGEPSSWFALIESLKMTCARSYARFLNFLSNGGLVCFLQPNVMPKVSTITVTCPKLGKWTSRVNFDLLKDSKMTINFELFKVAQWPVWKSTYLQSQEY